ncbi:hypothetical protein K469DRAFT_809224 [Zopfia rhizophila CBS 207.26]|uniref:SGNH hydrolase-type esterase domain-containing protein n=1 Tax=Zopfia rhizophila CBS 207.26 TaxID=1314779 RepID=A0A6A6EJV0_9PEZI|nr:hypothetical protein K469DRAFT_809224 [Zopfia rhizophila CBS 207.26]
MKNQLSPGPNRDEDQFKMIGTPQIAVLTAGGNDFNFGGVVQKCILGVTGTGSCEKTLKDIEDKLQGTKRDESKAKYRELFSRLIVAGRVTKGANPPESFQVYIGTYIPFFNAKDDVCDDVSWNMWSSAIKLDKTFRKRLNDMVEGVNSIITEAADEMKEWGVYYVNGYQRVFDGHRWCDPVLHTFDKWDENYDKKYHSKDWQDLGSQTCYGGPISDEPATALATNNTQSVLEILIPDADQRAKVEKGEADPGEFSDAFKDNESLKAALNDIQSNNPNVKKIPFLTDDSWFRIWHPKGNALKEMANGFFETIKEQRKWDFRNTQADPNPQKPT